MSRSHPRGYLFFSIKNTSIHHFEVLRSFVAVKIFYAEVRKRSKAVALRGFLTKAQGIFMRETELPYDRSALNCGSFFSSEFTFGIN